MASHESTYQPSTRFEKWLDARLPVMRMMHAQFVDFPTPRNINYLWTAGALLTFCLAVQILTGVVLAMHYAPTAADAFNSVEHIRRDVNYGWLIRNIHAVGASMFFLAVYIHIGRGLYYGSYKAPREVLWIIGVIIFLLMMATAFMGYSLPWGQMSFWAVTVITNLFSSLDSVIPGLGTRIVQWLWGGYSVSGTTLNRFYSLHYLLPFAIVGLVVLHIWALHVVGQNNPTGLEIKTASDSVPMAPHAVMKDTFALAVFVVLFAWFVFYLPDYLGHADNYIEANPLSTPPHIVPEWYFLPYYAILRAIPNKLLRRDRHVLVDHPAVLRAVARHLARALGQVPPGLQVVLLAVHLHRGRARLPRLQAGGGHLRDVGAHLHGLLLHALPDRDADRRGDGDAHALAAIYHRVGAGQRGRAPPRRSTRAGGTQCRRRTAPKPAWPPS